MSDIEEANSRDRILEVGAQLFLDHGYADTTLRKIGAEVGMQAASIYYHFPSKDDLLLEILQQGITSIGVAFDDAVAGATGRDGFAAAVAGHLAALYGGGPFTAAHVTVFRRAPEKVRAAIVPLRDAYEAKWQKLLEGLANEGYVRTDLDLRLVRLTLLGAMNSALEWFRPAGAHTIDALAQTITQQFWVGLAPDYEKRET